MADGSGLSIGNVTWPPDPVPAVGVAPDPLPQAATRKGTAARAIASFDRPKSISTLQELLIANYQVRLQEWKKDATIKRLVSTPNRKVQGTWVLCRGV